MTTLIDAGFLYALLNRRDPNHSAVLRVAQTLTPPVFLPIPTITEVAYLLQKYVGVEAMAEFVEGLATTYMQLTVPLAETIGERLLSYGNMRTRRWTSSMQSVLRWPNGLAWPPS